jgi:uncharacterized coiled-coil DUF342 family protein
MRSFTETRKELLSIILNHVERGAIYYSAELKQKIVDSLSRKAKKNYNAKDFYNTIQYLRHNKIFINMEFGKYRVTRDAALINSIVKKLDDTVTTVNVAAPTQAITIIQDEVISALTARVNELENKLKIISAAICASGRNIEALFT